MTHSHSDEAPRQLQGGPLRVTFSRCGDRYKHLVEILHPDQRRFVPVLESVEGTGDEPWPASPPLEQIHFEQRPGQCPVALLVGEAGRSHWSLSAELNQAAGRVTFDVACRLHGPPQQLTSCYRLPSAAERDEAHDQVRLGPCGHLRLEPVGQQTVRLCLAEIGAGRLCRLTVHVPVVAGPWPQTVRWRYVVMAQT